MTGSSPGIASNVSSIRHQYGATINTEYLTSEPKPGIGSILEGLLGPDPTQAVCDAIREGRESDVEKLCRMFKGRATLSPKRAAIDAKWLIDRGANLNARDGFNETPLSSAISGGTLEVVQLLLAHGTHMTHGDLLHHTAEHQN